MPWMITTTTVNLNKNTNDMADYEAGGWELYNPALQNRMVVWVFITILHINVEEIYKFV